MTHENLQSVLDTTDNMVEMLRNAPGGPNVYPGVPAEYTNWRAEQYARQHSCVLFNLSYYIADLEVGSRRRVSSTRCRFAS